MQKIINKFREFLLYDKKYSFQKIIIESKNSNTG